MYIQHKSFSSFHVLALYKNDVSVEDENKLIQQLKGHNVTVFSLSKCYVGDPKLKGLILGYSSVRPNFLKQKVKQMTELL